MTNVQPEPTSFTLKATLMPAVGQVVVRVDIFTVTGTTVLFGTPEAMLEAFDAVRQVAETGRRSLIVPPSALGDPPTEPRDN
jgi:hypothetical protein